MKILPFDPKAVSNPGSLDHSRLGFHARQVNMHDLLRAEHGIVLFGIADDTGIRNVGGRIGSREGPQAVRQRLYKFTSGATAFPLYDLGDLQAEVDIEDTHAAAAAVVKELAAAGHFPLVIGGGHDLGFPHALGVLEAFEGRPFRICNIDAHLDLRPVDHGVTSGSPWYLLNEHPLFQVSGSSIEEFGIQPHCNARVLVDYAEKEGIAIHWLADLRRRGKTVLEQFTKVLGAPKAKEQLLVSLDIDCVRFSDAPGCSAPQTLGFSAEEVIRMSFESGRHPRVESFGLFELSPPLDPDGRTALLAAHCINACLEGYAIRKKVKAGAKKKKK
jgi:formiminoglutamase